MIVLRGVDMAFRLLTLALASVLFQNILCAQPLYESGSIEAYRQRVAAERQAQDMAFAAKARREKWQQSTKLKLSPGIADPTDPHSSEECLDLGTLAEGQVGYLDCYLFEVFDIAGPKDIYLVIENPDIPPIALKGHVAKGLTTEQQVVVCGLVEVKGTTSYIDTEGGNVTIRNITHVTPEREAEINDERETQAEAQQLIAEEMLFRKWTSANGKHTVEAKFLKFEKGNVHLQNRKGSIIKMSPNDLSKDDRMYYRELVKSRNDPAYGVLKAFSPN